jgi:putative ABC transport system ATP-binding protein
MIGQPLAISGLHKTYPGNAHPVFDGFDLAVEAGSLCAIVGVSGVGKTTLLNCVAGLDHWEAGGITIGGNPVPVGAEARALYRRRHVGLAFQQPHLLPEFTVRENLRMPLLIQGDVPAEAEAWIGQLLSIVGLGDLGERLPGQLSGGEAARVGLARALVRKPALWLLDEPTGNLDPDTASEVFEVLLDLHREWAPTTLMVTHNLALAERCSRVERLRGAGHDTSAPRAVAAIP